MIRDIMFNVVKPVKTEAAYNVIIFYTENFFVATAKKNALQI